MAFTLNIRNSSYYLAKFFYICCLLFSANSLMRCAKVAVPVAARHISVVLCGFQTCLPIDLLFEIFQKRDMKILAIFIICFNKLSTRPVVGGGREAYVSCYLGPTGLAVATVKTKVTVPATWFQG